MVAEPSSQRSFCSTCGYPLSDARCGLCGGSAEPLALKDGVFDPEPPRSALHAELEWAREAWSKKEYARLVTHCLAVEGVANARTVSHPEGPGFVAVIRGVGVAISIRQGANMMVMDAPVARLPERQRIPAMRAALELSHIELSAIRLCLRKDLVVARHVGRLTAMRPRHLLAAMIELSHWARRYGRLLEVSFDARRITPEGHASVGADGLPRPLALPKLAPNHRGAVTRKVAAQNKPESVTLAGPSLFDSIPPIIGNTPAAEVRTEDRTADVALPTPEPTPPPVERPRAQSKPPRKRSHDSMPAILSPLFAAGAEADGEARPAPPAEPRSATLPPPPPPPASQIASTRRAKPPPPSPAASSEAAQLGLPPVPKVSGAASPQHQSADPERAFCDLLHTSQTLATALSFQDLPATMMLLVRATVYRAVFEYHDDVPNAVAHLFQETHASLREIWITAPGKRRGSMQIPSVEPALSVMEGIVERRGRMPPTSPVRVKPITSAQEAKQHLARFVSEIEQSPDDLGLRHFLALGGLCELLVRTKLPAATQEKLRSIVLRARRDGPTTATVELMTTALKRIVG